MTLELRKLDRCDESGETVDWKRLLDFRDQVLTPHHSGRQLIWPHDLLPTARHLVAELTTPAGGVRIVGCLSYNPESMASFGLEPGGAPELIHSPRAWHLSSMGVDPLFQSRPLRDDGTQIDQPQRPLRGMGTLLLTTMIAELADENPRPDMLWATARDTALGFYTGFGMTVLDGDWTAPGSGMHMNLLALMGETLNELYAHAHDRAQQLLADLQSRLGDMPVGAL